MSPTTAATKKRKSDTDGAAASKKAKLAEDAVAKQTVEGILSDASNFVLPGTEKDTRALILQLSKYARNLEQEVDSYKPKEKGPKELEAAADKLANVVRSGIKKQMGVSLSLSISLVPSDNI